MSVRDSFWGALPGSQIEVAERLLTREVLGAGDVLFRQGDHADHAYFVTHGSFAVSVKLPGGGEVPLTSVAPPGVLGELALGSTAHRRTATAVAEGPSEVLAMHRRDLFALCAHYHPAALALLSALSEHVQTSLARISGERLALGVGPAAQLRAESEGRSGVDCPAATVLARLPFAATMSDWEREALIEIGQLRTYAGAEAVRTGRGTAVLILRGAVEVCGVLPRGALRLHVAGPGTLLRVTDEMTRLIVRERVELLRLDAEAMAGLADPSKRISYRFQESALCGLIRRLEQDTRALVRERRQAGAGG